MNYFDILFAEKESGGGSGLQVESKSGELISYNNGANLPINKCIVDITATQSGSGDPSPSNIRPISGWSEANLYIRGKNLIKNLKWQYNTKNIFLGTSDGTSVNYFLKKGKYTLSLNTTIQSTYKLNYGINDGSGIVVDISSPTQYTFEVLEDANYRFWLNSANNILASDVINFQLEIGETATTYEPYQGITKTVDFNQDVYGGSANLLTGEGVITHGNIASYNGETLPSTWISDRDVYASGTTPTTGAQVVYELATPTTFTFTPIPTTNTLEGVNNIYADCGDIDELEVIVNGVV